MSDGSMVATLVDIQLDSSAGLPRYRQLYDSIRGSILAGRLRAGARLPLTWALASGLGISCNTVLTAYAQLLAEGYVQGVVGSCTYVAHAPVPAASRRAPRRRGRCRVAACASGAWPPLVGPLPARCGPSASPCQRSMPSHTHNGDG